MSFFGGDVKELKVEHPTLGSKVFEPKSAEDTESNRGGVRINDDDNGVTAAGSIILSGSVTRPYLQVTVAIDDDREDYLNEWAASAELATITYTLITGTVFRGLAIPVGDLKPSTLNATMQVKFAGSGKFQKI